MMLSANINNAQNHKQTFDKLARIGLDEGWLYKSESDAIAKNAFDASKIGDLQSLGILKSSISKLYASADMAKAIKRLDNFCIFTIFLKF